MQVAENREQRVGERRRLPHRQTDVPSLEASMMQMAESRRKTKASAQARMEQAEQARARRELVEVRACQVV
eukprot:1157049-Pelagomonas_calceolata.AAC.6